MAGATEDEVSCKRRDGAAQARSKHARDGRHAAQAPLHPNPRTGRGGALVCLRPGKLAETLRRRLLLGARRGDCSASATPLRRAPSPPARPTPGKSLRAGRKEPRGPRRHSGRLASNSHLLCSASRLSRLSFSHPSRTSTPSKTPAYLPASAPRARARLPAGPGRKEKCRRAKRPETLRGRERWPGAVNCPSSSSSSPRSLHCGCVPEKSFSI